MSDRETIAIIGNGISGITAARHIRKQSNKRIVVIGEETKYFFSRTALMYVYMGHMKFEHTQPYENDFWEKNDIELIHGRVESIDYEEKELKIYSRNVHYDKLIIATGSVPNKFGWKGQDLEGAQGMYSYQDLQSLESRTNKIKHAVVVGGGLIGVELTEMLLSRGISVSFLVREPNFWGVVLSDQEGKMIIEHMVKDHKVDLRLETELDEIIDDGTGQVSGIRTKSGEIIDCQFVGLTAGVSPNIDFLREGKLEVNRGVLVNPFLETNIKDVYAIGDCAEMRKAIGDRRPIEQVWYTGRMMGETIAKTITGDKTAYKPSHWFNSAKFFDIEYQTYGRVWPNLKPSEEGFFWKHVSEYIAVNFSYHKKTRKLHGVNSFGLRLRHQVLEHWLNNEVTIEYALEHLMDAWFDPELYKNPLGELVEAFNVKNNTKIKIKEKKWSRLLKAFQLG